MVHDGGMGVMSGQLYTRFFIGSRLKESTYEILKMVRAQVRRIEERQKELNPSLPEVFFAHEATSVAHEAFFVPEHLPILVVIMDWIDDSRDRRGFTTCEELVFDLKAIREETFVVLYGCRTVPFIDSCIVTSDTGSSLAVSNLLTIPDLGILDSLRGSCVGLGEHSQVVPTRPLFRA